MPKFWEAGKNVIGTTFEDIKSERRYGIELEVGPLGQKERELLEAYKVWGAKPDGTSGVDTEFYSPILQGDEGLECIRYFSNLALKFEINDGCGFHMHIDCTDLKDDQLKRVAVAFMATYPVWKLMVPKKREDNRYCHKDALCVHDLNNNENFLRTIKGNGDRYTWANWVAFERHHTLENRLHSGTTNYAKISNWVKANLRLTDWAVKVPVPKIIEEFGFRSIVTQYKVGDGCSCDECVAHFAESAEIKEVVESLGPERSEDIFVKLAEIWDDDDLTRYYLRRITKFLDTDSARKFDANYIKEKIGQKHEVTKSQKEDSLRAKNGRFVRQSL